MESQIESDLKQTNELITKYARRNIDHIDFEDLNKKRFLSHLVSHIYTADPSAHVFQW